MTAIILQYYQHVLTGTIFNVFEYYLTILEHNPDIKLIMVNGPDDIWDTYSAIYEDRYYLDGIDYRKGMLVMNYDEFKRINFDKVLVLDFGSIPIINTYINSKEIIVVSELHTDNPVYMFKKNQNAIYYGEMPFVYKDIDYRMKLGFDRFKTVNQCDEAIFVSSRAEKRVIKEKLKLLPNKPVYQKSMEHLFGFFTKWDEMLYIRTDKWYDPHPRIFLECAFYGKKMHYFNDENVKDGGWYRWKDVQENGIKDRTLSKEDEIIRQFI